MDNIYVKVSLPKIYATQEDMESLRKLDFMKVSPESEWKAIYLANSEPWPQYRAMPNTSYDGLIKTIEVLKKVPAHWIVEFTTNYY